MQAKLQNLIYLKNVNHKGREGKFTMDTNYYKQGFYFVFLCESFVCFVVNGF